MSSEEFQNPKLKGLPRHVYGRFSGEMDTELPDWTDRKWHWHEEAIRTDNNDLPSMIQPAPPAEPPLHRAYPQAPVYTLHSDSRFTRGYRYGTEFRDDEMVMFRQRLLHLNSPPEVIPTWAGDKYVWSPLSGMVEMIPGVPFTYDMPSGAVLTIGCVHTPASLREYGSEGEQVIQDLDILEKMTFGYKDAVDDNESFKPIYTIAGLNHNSRSSGLAAQGWDGSYSLASTRSEGDGDGCFFPALQNDTSAGCTQIDSLLQLLHRVWRRTFPWSVSKFEHDMVEFNQTDNNTFSFGGLQAGPTSLQINVSSLGVEFEEAIGNQGSWHVDVHDDPTEWTMAVLVLRLPPGSDPGAFELGRDGLYVRQGDIVYIILWFKGVNIHSGNQPGVHPQSWTNFIERVKGIYDKTDRTNRVMYVCYPSEAGIQRSASMAVTPAVHFGNHNKALAHKTMQHTFADHGIHILGGQSSYANRLGREHFYTFWNSLRFCNLTLHLPPDEILKNITYTDDDGNEIPLLPLPTGFHPVEDEASLTHMRAIYRWYKAQCHLVYVSMTKDAYKTVAKKSKKSSIQLSGLAGKRRPTALLSHRVTPMAECTPVDEEREEPESEDDEAEAPVTAMPKIPEAGGDNSDAESELTELSSSEDNEPKDNGDTSAGKRKSTTLSARNMLDQNATAYGYRSLGDKQDRVSIRATAAEEANGIYAVDSIIDFRMHFNQPEWLVRWVGFEEEHDTWQNWNSLRNCVEKVDKFNESNSIYQLLPETADNKMVAYDDATIKQLEDLFSSDDLRQQLREIKSEGNTESKHYFTTARKISLHEITTSLANRVSANHDYTELFAGTEESSPVQQVNPVFSQLNIATQSLPGAAQNLKTLHILHRCQQYDICRSFRIIHHFMTGPGALIAEDLLSRYIISKDLLDEVRFGLLVKHVVGYARKFFRSSAKSKATGKEVEPSGNTQSFPAVIDKALFTQYGFDVTQNTSHTKRPSQLRMKRPGPIAQNNDALIKACKSLLLTLWADYYIAPHAKALDSIISGSVTHESTDFTARAICRGAVITCIVDAFGSESILYSRSIMHLIDLPWIKFGSSAYGRAPQFADQCQRRADELFRPLFKFLVQAAHAEPESQSLADELADLFHAHLIALSTGGHADLHDQDGPDSITPNGQDSTGYRTKQAPHWQTVTSQSLVGADPSLDAMMLPVALILREASNAQRHMKSAEEELHRVMMGHYATTLRNIPFDPDLTNPVRRHSKSTELFFDHIPPSQLTTAQGLPNLLSWLGTGQGHQTRNFLIRHQSKFFAQNVQQLVQRFNDVMVHNASVLGGSAYKPGRSVSHFPTYIPCDNPRVWGQPCKQLSVWSHTAPQGTLTEGLQAKFGEYFSATVVSSWQCFLGELYNQDPAVYTGYRHSWYEALDFISDLRISGFKNGLTTLQAANLLTFTGIVNPPSALAVSSWVFSHKDLGAYRGLTRLGFRLGSISSVVAAFQTVHDHLDTHMSDEDKTLLGFSSGLSSIAVEHLLCKVVRWEKRLQHCRISWSRYASETLWVQNANTQDPLAFPIPIQLTREDVDRAVKIVEDIQKRRQ